MCAYELLPEDENVIKLTQTFEDELTKIKEREIILEEESNLSGAEKKKQVERYVNNYLNVLENMCFLRNRQSIDDITIKYFASELAYGLKLLQWKEDNILQDARNEYPNLVEVTRKAISNNNDPFPLWLDLYPK